MAAVLEDKVNIRPMRRRDLGVICGLEQVSYPFPWSREIFSDCLRVGYCCRVAENAGRVIAYAVLSIGASEAHVLNLCVAPEWRRGGLARRMLNVLLAEAHAQAAERVFLEVRPSNEAAVALYESAGFRTIGRRSGYYPAAAGREDALVMALQLGKR